MLLFITMMLAIFVIIKVGGGTSGDVLPWGMTHSKFVETSDSSSRLGWQFVAIKSIARNPLGYILGGQSWNIDALEGGADFSEFGYRTKAIHNSYLNVALYYGWIGGILMFIALLVLTKSIVKNISTVLCNDKVNTNFIAINIALIAALIQALFHNSSIFTNEPSSCVVLCLFLVWSDIIRKKND